MNHAPTIRDVSDTAFWVAHYRAVESERADALFKDPLAAVLAGERGREIAARMPYSDMTAWTLAIRTHVIDAMIQDAIAGGCDTVVNLGAGLDTRPYRMTLPTRLRWIEIDHPSVISYKERTLAAEKPQVELRRIALDLADAPARRALFQELAAISSQGVLVLTEGVIPYLAEAEVADLARDLRKIPSLRGWIVDYFSPAALLFARRSSLRRELGRAPFRFAPRNWAGFFAEQGWRATEWKALSDAGEHVGRRLPLPGILGLFTGLGRFFPGGALPAVRSAMSYVRLERVPT